MPINFICDNREKAVKEYDEVVSKLERASEIIKERKKLQDTLWNIGSLSKPFREPDISFEEYCKQNNIPTIKNFSFPTFSKYCSNHKIKKEIAENKYKKDFWDDAEKTFKYKYFRYVYGFYIVMFVDRSEEEKYDKCRDKYKNTRVGEFFKDLGKRKANIFSRIHKVPRQYYKEFLNLINELKKECDVHEETRKKYDEELNKAKEDYKAFLEDYYLKNSVREKYEQTCLDNKKKYDEEVAQYKAQKNQEPRMREKYYGLYDELQQITREIDGVKDNNVDFVLSYLKYNSADTVRDLLKKALSSFNEKDIKDKLNNLAKWRHEEGDKTYLADIIVFGKTEQITVKARNSSDAIDRIHSVSPSIRIEKIIGDNSI